MQDASGSGTLFLPRHAASAADAMRCMQGDIAFIMNSMPHAALSDQIVNAGATYFSGPATNSTQHSQSQGHSFRPMKLTAATLGTHATLTESVQRHTKVAGLVHQWLDNTQQSDAVGPSPEVTMEDAYDCTGSSGIDLSTSSMHTAPLPYKSSATCPQPAKQSHSHAIGSSMASAGQSHTHTGHSAAASTHMRHHGATSISAHDMQLSSSAAIPAGPSGDMSDVVKMQHGGQIPARVAMDGHTLKDNSMQRYGYEQFAEKASIACGSFVTHQALVTPCRLEDAHAIRPPAINSSERTKTIAVASHCPADILTQQW